MCAWSGPDAGPGAGRRAARRSPGRGPLVPFGGGIDSIVTVDAIAAEHRDTALFVLHPPRDRFAAIEGAAAVTGLPVTRVAREIDPWSGARPSSVSSTGTCR